MQSHVLCFICVTSGGHIEKKLILVFPRTYGKGEAIEKKKGHYSLSNLNAISARILLRSSKDVLFHDS